MTTTASKGAGRARHSARTTKAAQRTPLPPRDGSQNATPAEVEANAKARRAAVKSAPAKPAEATAPVAAAKRGGKATQAAKAAAAAIPEGTPGAAKATRIMEAAAASGWTASLTVNGTTLRVHVERGSEAIGTTFVDGKLDLSEMPTYHDGDRSVKLKNVSAVLKQMTGEKPTAKPVTERRTRTPRPKASPETAALPFDPEASSDEEVLDAIRGRSIEWMNMISRNVEHAVVLASRTIRGKMGEPVERPVKIGIAPHPQRNTRVVTFTDGEATGTRSVALDRITRVGR